MAGVVLIIVLCFLFPATNWFVVWEPHSGRKQSCYLCTLPMGVNVF